MEMSSTVSRREFLTASGSAIAGALLSETGFRAQAQEKGERPETVRDVRVVNPQARVPVSFIIDDSTCLVNLAHFCIPQFAEVFPDRYLQDWRKLPREIPDSFVREFGEWCGERGIKGKYSIVPYPACVGWVDREMPGWTRKQLEDSIQLVRDLMMPSWDIHPEMVTHTWVIDTATGRPYPERSGRFMENWKWTDGKSVDQLANYISYALRILKNAGLTCEGMTTPGGFGNAVLPELSQATLQACRDVFSTEIPHYFRHIFTDGRSVAPRVEYASGLKSDDPRCVVSIIGCTGDWFGGWDGLTPGTVDQFITEDLTGGRLPEVIRQGEPAILVCHWPGIYFNGEKTGFRIFQKVVDRLHQRYDHLIWMKLSEIARYWAAKELTTIEAADKTIAFQAPFATTRFTVQWKSADSGPMTFHGGDRQTPLKQVAKLLDLVPGTWHRAESTLTACFDLPKGKSSLLTG